MEQTSSLNKKEAVYEKARLSKRMIAYFFDISLWFLTSVIFFSILNTIVNNTPWYKSVDNQITEIKEDSKLYLDGMIISEYVDKSNTFENINQQNEFLTYNIDEFYKNSNFFTDTKHLDSYKERKLNAKGNGANLFILDGENIVENSVNPSYLNEFYKTEVNDYCVGYLFNNATYGNLTRTVFIKTIMEIVGSATLFFIVFFLVLPLTCFKRGRQTIGMKIEKIALINTAAVNVQTKTYVFRFLFMLVGMVYISFIAFLIPAFISVGMMFVSRNNQSLVNFTFNDYFVDVTNQHIYLNEPERYLALAKIEEVSIENKDFIIK